MRAQSAAIEQSAKVRLVAHTLAPQVEGELLEGMQQQYTTHGLYCAQRRATF